MAVACGAEEGVHAPRFQDCITEADHQGASRFSSNMRQGGYHSSHVYKQNTHQSYIYSYTTIHRIFQDAPVYMQALSLQRSRVYYIKKKSQQLVHTLS